MFNLFIFATILLDLFNIANGDGENPHITSVQTLAPRYISLYSQGQGRGLP